MLVNINQFYLCSYSSWSTQYHSPTVIPRDNGLIPRLGRFPGEGNGNPLQYPCLENAMDRGTWRAAVHGVTKESNTTGHFTLHSIHITDDNLLS